MISAPCFGLRVSLSQLPAPRWLPADLQFKGRDAELVSKKGRGGKARRDWNGSKRGLKEIKKWFCFKSVKRDYFSLSFEDGQSLSHCHASPHNPLLTVWDVGWTGIIKPNSTFVKRAFLSGKSARDTGNRDKEHLKHRFMVLGMSFLNLENVNNSHLSKANSKD